MANEEHIATLYPAIQNDMQGFVDEAKQIGAYIYMSFRSVAQQNELYAQGRTKPGQIVTKARGGLSFHNYGLAIDMAFKNSKGAWYWPADNSPLWATLGRMAKEHGIEHGDRGYVDLPHFQIVFGQIPQNLLAAYEVNKSLQDVWDGLDEVRKEM
jgi:peptidoglycan L-alanyl-D-glutamate endopeptidase CwlK